jgi:hypothetical protein
MTSNRLLERTAQPDVSAAPRFGSKFEHAAHLNGTLKRDDVEWIVDQSGSLRLVDRVDWSSRRTQEIADERERERQRYNWRLQHPIADNLRAPHA